MGRFNFSFEAEDPGIHQDLPYRSCMKGSLSGEATALDDAFVAVKAVSGKKGVIF